MVSEWTHKRARGERVPIEPPSMQPDGSVVVTNRMGRIDSEVGRKMAARDAAEAEKKRIADEKAAEIAAAKEAKLAAKAAEKAAKEQAATVAAAPPEPAPADAAEATPPDSTATGSTSIFGSVRKRITNIFGS